VAEQLNGKYILEELVGRGGMGEVFAGRAVGMEGISRPVAIKMIHARYSDEPARRSMLIAEAHLAAKLSHSNIVAFHDLDQDDTGRLFLVMELVDGINLAHLLRAGALPLPVTLFVTCEILRGLDHAHELPGSEDPVRGLVHRDLSPENILISWDGAVKVSDFGLAKARVTMTASASLEIKGKPAYMSPEHANRAALDGRSDLFSVGVMLWEMTCGARLFDHSSLAATVRSVLFEPIPSPRSRVPGLPHEVDRITMRLLERDRSRRYDTAGAAIEALLECAAYPKNGRELLSALLGERLPARARHRSAGGERLPGSLDEETALAPPIAPLFAPAEPYPAPPRSGRAQRAISLGLLVVATALATILAVGAVPRIGGGGSPAVPVPTARVAPPVEPQVNHEHPGEVQSEMRDIKVTSAPLQSSAVSAVSAVPVAPAPTMAPQNHRTRASVGRAPAGDRQAPPAPSLESKGHNGIRVIDLRDFAPTTSARREEAP